MRIRKRTLVYIVGLPVQLADPALLQRREYMGQYGAVRAMELNSPHERTSRPDATYRAYVTFATELEALVALLAVSGCQVLGAELRASFGLTKYCVYFLRKEACPNSQCTYIHAKARKEDTFFREDINDYRLFNPERLQRVAAEIVAENAEEFARLGEGEEGRGVFPGRAAGVRALRAVLSKAEQSRSQRLRRAVKPVAEAPKITAWEDGEDVPVQSQPERQDAENSEALAPVTADTRQAKVDPVEDLRPETAPPVPNRDLSPQFAAQVRAQLELGERLQRHPLQRVSREDIVQGYIDRLILARIERSADALNRGRGSRILSPSHATAEPYYPRWEPEMDSLLQRFLLLEEPAQASSEHVESFQLFGQSYDIALQ